jgi:hypothetical protein
MGAERIPREEESMSHVDIDQLNYELAASRAALRLILPLAAAYVNIVPSSSGQEYTARARKLLGELTVTAKEEK